MEHLLNFSLPKRICKTNFGIGEWTGCCHFLPFSSLYVNKAGTQTDKTLREKADNLLFVRQAMDVHFCILGNHCWKINQWAFLRQQFHFWNITRLFTNCKLPPAPGCSKKGKNRKKRKESHMDPLTVISLFRNKAGQIFMLTVHWYVWMGTNPPCTLNL